MGTVWFVMMETAEGLSPLMTKTGNVVRFKSFEFGAIEKLMKELKVIRWQAYVWVFPSEVVYERPQKEIPRANVHLEPGLKVSRDSVQLRRLVASDGG